MSLNECFGNNIGIIGNDLNSLYSFAENIKSEKRKNILFISIPTLLILIAIHSVIKRNENKINPIKNLEALKQSSIIDDEEFDTRMKQINEIEIQNKEEKKIQKLIDDLKNLKAKGILTQKEFDEKLALIKQKKQ